MAAPKAYSIRPQSDCLRVTDALTNTTWHNITVPSGYQNFHLSGNIMTVIAKDGRVYVHDLDRRVIIHY